MRSRSAVATYAAKALLDKSTDRSALVNSLAAWLKDTKNSRSATYLVQDIAKKLAENGYIYVTITTAHPLTIDTQTAITKYLRMQYDADDIFEFNEVINPKVIGGVRIDTPHGSLDATVKRKLIQIIKGV